MNIKNSLVIGIDSSTTACKAVVVNDHGELMGSGRAGLGIAIPQAGWHEQSAVSWWQALVRALRQALQGIDRNRLAGIAIAHQRETFVALDTNGKPIRPAMLWMDERAAPLLSVLQQHMPADRYHRLTGKPLSANLTVAKIAWMRDFEPQHFARAAQYLDTHAYLVWRLTGAYRTSWGSADPTGLFDMPHHTWSPEAMHLCGISERQLPEVIPPGRRLGLVNAAAAHATGLPEGLPVIAGLGDGQAGGVGANICSKGSAYLALGTSVISGSYSPRYLVDRAFRTMTGDEHSFLLETVLLGGVYTLEWLLKTFLGKRGAGAARQRAAWDRVIDQIPAGSEGLMVVPYWNSAMNPYWDASARGMTIGWRGNHRPEHLYHAILEGIAFELRLQLEAVEAVVEFPLERLVAMGGGAQNAHWRQIIANVTGKPVTITAAGESAALGAAILAAVGAGWFADVPQAAQSMAPWQTISCNPQPRQVEFYQNLYQKVYRNLYPALRESLTHLSHLVGS